MILEELLSRRLLFVSGKGGVGKSVTAAVLARAACERGRRVLLATVDAPPEGVDAGPAEVRPGLFACHLDPARVMDDYVHHVVRVPALVRRILESPIYRRFFAAAPGLKELMLLGKLMVLEREREGLTRHPRWDLIVVDAPASGHGLSLLRVPGAAAAAIPVGPVGREARRILALLRDRKRTALAIVAIPEEMAVVEALELQRDADDAVGIHTAAVVLNACHERRLTRQQEAEVLRLAAQPAGGSLTRGVPLAAALEAARRHVRLRKRTRFHLDRLRRRQPAPVVTLPFLHEEAFGEEALSRLGERVQRW